MAEVALDALNCSGSGDDDDERRRRWKKNQEPEDGPVNMFSWAVRRHRRVAAELRILATLVNLAVLRFEAEDVSLTSEEKLTLETTIDEETGRVAELLVERLFAHLGRNAPADWEFQLVQETRFIRMKMLTFTLEALRQRCPLEEDVAAGVAAAVLTDLRSGLNSSPSPSSEHGGSFCGGEAEVGSRSQRSSPSYGGSFSGEAEPGHGPQLQGTGEENETTQNESPIDIDDDWPDIPTPANMSPTGSWLSDSEFECGCVPSCIVHYEGLYS
jgi:hypothetical protein